MFFTQAILEWSIPVENIFNPNTLTKKNNMISYRHITAYSHLASTKTCRTWKTEIIIPSQRPRLLNANQLVTKWYKRTLIYIYLIWPVDVANSNLCPLAKTSLQCALCRFKTTLVFPSTTWRMFILVNYSIYVNNRPCQMT